MAPRNLRLPRRHDRPLRYERAPAAVRGAASFITIHPGFNAKTQRPKKRRPREWPQPSLVGTLSTAYTYSLSPRLGTLRKASLPYLVAPLRLCVKSLLRPPVQHQPWPDWRRQRDFGRDCRARLWRAFNSARFRVVKLLGNPALDLAGGLSDFRLWKFDPPNVKIRKPFQSIHDMTGGLHGSGRVHSGSFHRLIAIDQPFKLARLDVHQQPVDRHLRANERTAAGNVASFDHIRSFAAKQAEEFVDVVRKQMPLDAQRAQPVNQVHRSRVTDQATRMADDGDFPAALDSASQSQRTHSATERTGDN